ncbi:MAG: hypothetical protein KGZ63_01680 [Clostridiales bacterium]|jgi:hypothetical protein|nr:hypothetical protein [Clostridiales bacterium]
MLSAKSKTNALTVPNGLRLWFIIHFVVDITFAIPLFFIPETVLGIVGWPNVDPLATRLVAAALFGIGTESFLGRNGSVERFQGMLNLKIIWSVFAVMAIAITMVTHPLYVNVLTWAGLVIFSFFLLLWSYWKLLLRY